MINLLMGLNSNNVIGWKYFLGIILSIAVCFVVYVIIMALYTMVRKRNPNAKYWIEVLFISVGLLFSVATKLLVLADIDLGDDYKMNHSLWEYFSYSLSAIYSLVGSLQFEGLPFSFSELPALQSCLYYGSSIIAGLILLSVITAKASYEIYSLISLRFARIIDFFRRKNSVFIFNSLTKDSIILAKSIKKEYENNKNGKNAVIIFSGNNIPSFSRNDPLCREIMLNSFYYYSLSSGSETKHSTLSRLKLKKCNVSSLTFDSEANCFIKKSQGIKHKKKTTPDSSSNNQRKPMQKRLCEFYFELEEDKKPNQERNTTDAFKELDLIIGDVFKIKKETSALKLAKNKLLEEIKNINKDYNRLNFELYSYAKKPSKETLQKIKNEEHTAFGNNNVYKSILNDIANGTYKYSNELIKKDLKKILEKKLTEYVHSVAQTNHWCITEHYVLTFSDSNYEFYAKELNSRVVKLETKLISSLDLDFSFIEKEKGANENPLLEKSEVGIIFDETIVKYLKALNQIHVINESHLTSISLVEKRNDAIKENSTNELGKGKATFEKTLLKHLGYSEDTKQSYNALILGFGGNGQSSLNSIFYESAVVNKKCELNNFYADVFDQNIDDIAAIFAKNHPLYRCFMVTDDSNRITSESESLYAGGKENCIIKNDEIQDVFRIKYPNSSILDEPTMKFPLVQFHNTSCTSFDFINFFDSVTGNNICPSSETKAKSCYNIIVISFGSDRKNIAIANTIIDDIRRECLHKNTNANAFKQCIAVNIRDDENLDKLNWTEDDKHNRFLKDVIVFSFGAKEDIYSYAKILNYEDQYVYSTNYESMQGLVETDCIKTLSAYLKKDYETPEDAQPISSLKDTIKSILDYRNQANNSFLNCLCNQISYLSLNHTKKEVNRISALFGTVMCAVIKEHLETAIGGEDESDTLYKLMKNLFVLEHEKWCRFYLSEGWIYNKNKNESVKLHDCLIPLKFVDKNKYGYDLINVVAQWQKVTQKDKKENKREDKDSSEKSAKKKRKEKKENPKDPQGSIGKIQKKLENLQQRSKRLQNREEKLKQREEKLKQSLETLQKQSNDETQQ